MIIIVVAALSDEALNGLENGVRLCLSCLAAYRTTRAISSRMQPISVHPRNSPSRLLWVCLIFGAKCPKMHAELHQVPFIPSLLTEHLCCTTGF
jgi:hypothetical protein